MDRLNGKGTIIWFGGVVFAFTLSGCSCPENEYDAVDACEKISVAVNEVLRQGGLSEQSENTICGETCSTVSSCRPKTEIDACVALIKSMAAADVDLGAYRTSSDCVLLFDEMSASCASSSSSSDFDD